MKALVLFLAASIFAGHVAQAQTRREERREVQREVRHEERREVQREVRRDLHRPPVVVIRPGWRYDRYVIRPNWWITGWALTHPFYSFPVIYPGYFHCVAFNNQGLPFTGTGIDQNSAAYNATASCEASQWGQFGCYIPAGYCAIR